MSKEHAYIKGDPNTEVLLPGEMEYWNMEKFLNEYWFIEHNLKALVGLVDSIREELLTRFDVPDEEFLSIDEIVGYIVAGYVVDRDDWKPAEDADEVRKILAGE